MKDWNPANDEQGSQWWDTVQHGDTLSPQPRGRTQGPWSASPTMHRAMTWQGSDLSSRESGEMSYNPPGYQQAPTALSPPRSSSVLHPSASFPQQTTIYPSWWNEVPTEVDHDLLPSNDALFTQWDIGLVLFEASVRHLHLNGFQEIDSLNFETVCTNFLGRLTNPALNFVLDGFAELKSEFWGNETTEST